MVVNNTRKLFEKKEGKYVAINYLYTVILKSGKDFIQMKLGNGNGLS